MDIVISALEWTQIGVQTSVIKAAEIAGVKRIIPCDWGTACVPGVRYLFDQVCNSFHISINFSNLEEFVST